VNKWREFGRCRRARNKTTSSYSREYTREESHIFTILSLHNLDAI
jgi:hypothetical protein